ncbi:MAG TPA: hypothetical protein VGL62_16130 [Vicinamibacterales bacterium]|jgi:hypothetical protein
MRRLSYAFVIALVLLLAPACGGASGQTQSASGGRRQPAATISTSGPAGNPCDRKLVGQADLAGITTSPVQKVEALEGDPQSCVFSTAMGTITVTVRPGLGNVSVSGWEKGQMNVPATPMSGVGDRAVWQDTMKEVIATKNDVLCDISVMGPPGTAAAGAQKRLGDLCNTIFSRQ